jgi:hypothetical protein
MLRFFRRNTIFHAETSTPDSEELKVRFRRRVLALTFLGFLVILGLPVIRALNPDLAARSSARILAQVFVETRALASLSRTPVSLTLLADGKTWERRFHLNGDNCQGLVEGPEQVFTFENFWKIQMQVSSGEAKLGEQICVHPRRGILLGDVALENGTLLIAANQTTEDFSASYLLFSEFGADVQIVSNRRPL